MFHMSYEVEQKFAVDDVAALIAALERLGAALGAPVDQEDRYLAHPARDFGATDEAFRLRRDGAGNAMTYKGPRLDRETKTRVEIEVAIANGDQAAADAAELFAMVGFSTTALVRKQRRHTAVIWRGGELAVVLDVVERLGTFAEIERVVDTPEDVARAKDDVKALAAELGLTRDQRKSYLEMILELEGRA